MPEMRCDIIECYVFRRRWDAPQFLQLRRAAHTYMGETWHPVAGRIEPDETALRACLRELHEETGLRPLRLWQLESVNMFFIAARDQIVLCPGFAAEVHQDAQVHLSPEHTAARWLARNEASDAFLWPGQRVALRELLDIIIAGSQAEPYLRVDPAAWPSLDNPRE